MAFHETYWVVTGTAAPVIALAAVVSVGDLINGLNAARSELPTITHRLSGAGSRTLNRCRLAATYLALLQMINVVFQAGLLVASLAAIAHQSGSIADSAAAAIAATGLLIVAAGGLGSLAVKARTLQVIGRAKERSRGSAPDFLTPPDTTG